MATREELKTKAARVREEARETGKVISRAPVLVRAAECVTRFLLGAMLSGVEIFGGHAPLGLGLAVTSGSRLGGSYALLGARFGCLSFQGFTEGLQYVAGCTLAFSLAFTSFDVKAYRKSWFTPLAAAGMDGVAGFVYLSDRGWSSEGLIFFGTELLLCGVSAYFYRIASILWTEKREEKGLISRQMVNLLTLAGTLLFTPSKIILLGDLSVGRCAAAAAVMTTAYKGGIGVGATVEVACSFGTDLAVGGMPFYSMASALSGAMCGVFRQQGRLAAALAYVLSNALVVLWTWSEGLHLSLLYEVLIASVVFLALPERVLRQVGVLVVREPRHDTQERARAHIRARMEATAAAFKSLYESIQSVLHPAAPNDNDAISVFDQAAGRVYKRCPLQTVCWQWDYASIFNALSDALPTMLGRDRGESGSLPAYFSSRCVKLLEFLSAVNEELAALLCRWQFQSRLSGNRPMVCRQYAELAGVLNTAAAGLGTGLVPDPVREKRLRQYLAAQGIDRRPVVYYDQAGHPRLEPEGAGLAPFRTEEGTAKSSKLVNFPLWAVEEGRRDRLVLVQSEPLMITVGATARKKDGQTVSGNTGARLKRDDGSLYMPLRDGMGSGSLAEQENVLAVRLLEQFLRAGARSENVLRILSSALALRNDEAAGDFTTIDLLRVDLLTGEAGVYKYGVIPIYVKKGYSIRRITGTTLPAGLTAGEGGSPDVAHLQLEVGDYVFLVTDGVAGNASDQWVRDRLAVFDDGSLRELAQAFIDGSGAQVGVADDRATPVLKFVRRNG